MSGIAGIIHFDGRPVEAGLIEGMTTAMAYRGPDGISHWQDGSVALGQCMLRTTPESLEEAQPLVNEDASLVLVMDGRVDNWEELRRELLAYGAKLRDRSDAELVLRAFEAWGRDCLERIDGDFALAIWSARERTLFCARDRIGNKPFHYHWDGRAFAFASDLHPILALPWVEKKPNEGMLAEFLAAQWHSRDETLWSGILRLLPAHRMDINARGVRTLRYWRPDLHATSPFSTDDDYIGHYRELLADAVRRASRSHRPLACEVSGGLDSSAVFAVADALHREARLPAPAIAGYTLAFEDRGDAAYELGYARAVGERLRLPVHEIPPSMPDLGWFDERACADRDFPGFPNAAMFSGLRARAAADGSRVVLTGEGGDEWLEGSRDYYAEEIANGRWKRLRECLRADTAAFGAAQAARWLLRHGLVPLLPAWSQDALRAISHALRGTGPSPRYWLAPAMLRMLNKRRCLDPLPPRPHRGRIGQFELLLRLQDVLGERVVEDSERICARAGLEMRCPLRDRRIIEFAFATPERLRLRGTRSKYLHVRALHDLLPASVLERIDKAEFSSVFRAPLDRMKRHLTRELPARRPDWVTREGMSHLYRHFRAHPDSGWPLWVLWSVHSCDRICSLERTGVRA